MSSPLDDQAMSQLQSQQSELLDKIDELRAIGIGGLVGLPQIIVCGNQSSGKSSVLEAISRVRFPSKSNICTRFATEIVLRRSPTEKIKVSIEPEDSRKDEQEQQRL
ncbi:Dynamin [Penicillium concentricum]|uniref:Dynamin n=1 Tax=Penicillium concentricum TaxID=293559 RepID=A0A9W9RI73_9EURO|nr:Dynamin [Penicillium concentricum]KAJ5360680.1 Dynamin [Penicillium concentricum]